MALSRLGGETALRSPVESMLFLAVAGTAEDLQVADVIGATDGEGDDMVDF